MPIGDTQIFGLKDVCTELTSDINSALVTDHIGQHWITHIRSIASDATPVPIPKRPEPRVVSGSRGRTYEYPGHVALLALVQERVVAEGAHVALPGGRWPLTGVDVAVEAVRLFRFWK